jgi:hypothetical protein
MKNKVPSRAKTKQKEEAILGKRKIQVNDMVAYIVERVLVCKGKKWAWLLLAKLEKRYIGMVAYIIIESVLECKRKGSCMQRKEMGMATVRYVS